VLLARTVASCWEGSQALLRCSTVNSLVDSQGLNSLPNTSQAAELEGGSLCVVKRANDETYKRYRQV
jgi:hypothetical protein